MMRSFHNFALCKLVAAMLAVSALGVAGVAAAKSKKPPPPLMSVPQPVRDLYYGDALFYFYQGDYFDSLVRLDAAESLNRLPHHQVEADLLKGGLYLSLGQHEEAGRIFQALLNDNVSIEVRNRAWFYLAKLWYQREYFDRAEAALKSINGALPDDLESERRLLLAQVLTYENRYDEATQVLQQLPARGAWSAYARFNLGVVLVRQQRLDQASALLDSVGQMEADSDEMLALRDKANLALGFAWLKENRAADAKRVLQRVRLEGPQSNKALLGVGWADSAETQYKKALVPWIELKRRDLLDSAVQEAYLAIPYAYAQLDANRQAAEQYVFAIKSFSEETARIDESIASIRAGRLLDAVLEHDKADETGWFWQLKSLPDAPETRYLYHLLATHEFQEGLKNYRDLRSMQRNLERWTLNIEAFHDMIDTRRLAYNERLPKVNATLDNVDMDGIEARVLASSTRVAAVERDNDVVALATSREQEQWQKVEKISQALAHADASDPNVAEMREKARLIRGVLYWDLNSSYKARLWRAKKESRELEVAAKEARRRWTLIERARDESPQRTDEYAARVAKLEPRLTALSVRLARASDAQNQYLANIAIAELEAQKQRLAAYSVQAQFALASIYDRAASGSGGAQ